MRLEHAVPLVVCWRRATVQNRMICILLLFLFTIPWSSFCFRSKNCFVYHILCLFPLWSCFPHQDTCMEVAADVVDNETSSCIIHCLIRDCMGRLAASGCLKSIFRSEKLVQANGGVATLFGEFMGNLWDVIAVTPCGNVYKFFVSWQYTKHPSFSC